MVMFLELAHMADALQLARFEVQNQIEDPFQMFSTPPK